MLHEEASTILKERPFSVSQLRTFDRCPKAYELQERLRAHWQQFAIRDIHEQLHILLTEEIRQHPSCRDVELFWYISGVLEQACRQPDMQLGEEQKQEILSRLRQVMKD